MKTENRFAKTGIYLLITCFIVLLSLPYHVGINVFDEGTYARCAFYLAHGKWIVKEDFFAARIGTILPYAMGISLFGFGKWLTFVTTIEFCLLLLVVYKFTALILDTVSARFAAFFLMLSPVLLQNASVIMGDIAAVLTINLPVMLYLTLRLKEGEPKRKQIGKGILFAAIFAIAFLVKETAVFYLPLIIFFLWVDWQDSYLKSFWLSAVISGIVCAIAVSIIYAIPTGDLFYRISAINTHQLQTNCVSADWQRYLSGPIQLMVNDYTFGGLFLLSVINVMLPANNKQAYMLKAWFIIPFITWWFAPTCTQLLPMALCHRLWIPLLIPMVLNSINALMELSKGTNVPHRRIITASIIFLMVYLLFSYISIIEYKEKGLTNMAMGAMVYAFFYSLVCFVIIMTVKQPGAIKPLLLFSLILLGEIAVDGYRSSKWLIKAMDPITRLDDYDREKEVFLFAHQQYTTLVTDPELFKNYGIYTQFSQVNSLNFDSVKTGMDLKGYALIINKPRMQLEQKNLSEAILFGKRDGTMPDFALHPTKYANLVKENETEALYVFR